LSLLGAIIIRILINQRDWEH